MKIPTKTNQRAHCPPRAWSILLALVLGGITLATRSSPGNQSANPSLSDMPPSVYASACAACHAHDGKGNPLDVVGFDVPLPDFTDCSFATREPDKDWYAVAHQGGPARGFDHRMPSFAEALSPEQIRQAIQHIRSFCDRESWPSGNLNLPRPMFTEKAFVEDEVVLTTGFSPQDPKEISGKLVYEQRFGKRSQFELVVPFGAIDIQADAENPGGFEGGLGDIALGIKHVILAWLPSGTILSGLTEMIFPTGWESQGFRNGTFVFEPSLLVGQSLGSAGFLHFQGGSEIPLESNPTAEGFWRLVYGKSFTQGLFGRVWSPMLGVLGSMELSSGAKAHWDLVPQVQVSLSTRQHIMLGLATRIPLEPDNHRSVSGWMYLLWEWFDGGLMEGW